VPARRLEPKHLQQRISRMISKMRTMTVTIAPTMVMRTVAMEVMMVLTIPPIAENIAPMVVVDAERD